MQGRDGNAAALRHFADAQAPADISWIDFRHDFLLTSS
jgi:hypothetical protein